MSRRVAVPRRIFSTSQINVPYNTITRTIPRVTATPYPQWLGVYNGSVQVVTNAPLSTLTLSNAVQVNGIAPNGTNAIQNNSVFVQGIGLDNALIPNNLTIGDFTIAAMFNFTDSQGDIVISMGGSTHLEVKTFGTEAQYINGPVDTSAFSGITDGQWHHYAVTYEYNTGFWKMYRDNSLLRSGSISPFLSINPALGSGSGVEYLGRNPSNQSVSCIVFAPHVITSAQLTKLASGLIPAADGTL